MKKQILTSLFLPILLFATPKAPSDLQLVAKTTSVDISWQDNSSNETGFKIFRDNKLIYITAPNVSHYVDSGLKPNTTYRYVIKATDDEITVLTAKAQSVSVNNGGSQTIVLSGVDPYGNSLTYKIATQPKHGTVTLEGNRAIYTPNSNYSGDDSFTFKVNDGKVDSALATVSITVKNSITNQIVARHNYYRSLDFNDSDLVWSAKLAQHAQTWAEYLAQHYTVADRRSGEIPHASKFQTDSHHEDDYNEGENIAWASSGLKYVRNNPVDIMVENSSTADFEFGAVDMWANEKVYYDYESNSGHGEVVGHYTQIVWQKTTKVGCGKAKSKTDIDGDWIVCRYEIPGNMTGEKPYCTNYTVSDLYKTDHPAFTNAMIDNKSFEIVKVLEDRSACTRSDIQDSTLTFADLNSASIPKFHPFNNSDLWDMNFDKISIENGILKLTNSQNDRYMEMKIVGETGSYYAVEAYWWVVSPQYNRQALLKLLK